MADTHLPPFWRERLITGVGGHVDSEKLRFLDAWARHEGGKAKWNPLNTTFDLPGATDYNNNGGIPVKNYSRPTWGICATILTFTGPAFGALYYPKLLGHLQSAADTYTAEKIVQDCAADLRKWGSNPDRILELLAESKA